MAVIRRFFVLIRAVRHAAPQDPSAASSGSGSFVQRSQYLFLVALVSLGDGIRLNDSRSCGIDVIFGKSRGRRDHALKRYDGIEKVEPPRGVSGSGSHKATGFEKNRM